MNNELAILSHSQGTVNDVNFAFCEQFGYSRLEVIGRDPLDLVLEEWRAIVQRKIETQDERPYYTLGKRKGDIPVPVYLQAKQIQTSAEISERVVIIRAVSDQARAHSCCCDAGEEVAQMAHELRTPLSTVVLALRMMKRAPSEEKQESYYQIALRTCEQEIQTIDSTLTLNRVASGAYPLAVERIPLGPWLLDRLESFDQLAQERAIDLSLEFPREQMTLESDPQLLSRILQELIGNACKYTPSGGQIQIQVIPADAGVTLLVGNTATIPTQALPHLFDRFYRVPESDVHNQGGSGLGLHLVKRLVGYLEGEIQVESRQGWTLFSLWIPQITIS